jgi:hypothetical protein
VSAGGCESLNPLAEKAFERGFLKLTPPVNKALRQRLDAKFPGLARTKVNVVEATGAGDNAKVAAVAAEKALKALVRIAKAKGASLWAWAWGRGAPRWNSAVS